MAIITISRGTYSKGKEIAEKVADKLGYKCIGRRILLEASEEFNIPEIKLTRALHDSPSVFNHFTYGKEKYIAYIQRTLLQHLQQGNTVYHGLAGQFFLKGVSHVLKVRIISDIEDRVKEEMKRENVSARKARQVLVKDDHERRQWSQFLYGVDTWDPSLYDLVLQLNKLTVDDVVDVITNVSKRPCFQETPESQKAFNDLLDAARIRSLLIEKIPTVEVIATNGKINVCYKGTHGQKDYMDKKINELLSGIPEYQNIHVGISSVMTPD